MENLKSPLLDAQHEGSEVSQTAGGRQPARVVIGGLPTVQITRTKFAAIMVADCKDARDDRANFEPKLVFSSNGQGLALAGRDRAFYGAMMQASWIHADGQSIVAASKLTKAPLPERIATTDFFHDAARAAEREGLSFYILGGSETQNCLAVARMVNLYPKLKVVGRRNGYFQIDEEQNICREIRDSGADVLWVGLGKPFQEEWAVRNRSNLHGIGWIKTCGGLYSFLAGESGRAPSWMQDAGLEWLYRAIREPRRLGWRYLTTNPYSLYRLLRYTKVESI